MAKPAQLVQQTFGVIHYAQMSVTRPICKTTKKITLFALNLAKIQVKNINIFFS